MKDLTEGKISKNLLLFTIPVIFSLTLSRAYTTIDQIMVGKLLGEVSLAAVGSTSSFLTFFSSLLWGAGMGIPLYIGFLSSKGEKSKTVSALKSNIVFLALVAFTISFLSIVFYKPIFSFLNVNKEIYVDAFKYYAIVTASKTMATVTACSNDIFNILGAPSHALKMSVINCVVNIFLNYLFIKILGFGVTGAAIATFISIAVVFAINVFALKKLIKSISTEKSDKKINFHHVKMGWKYALPCMAQQGVMYFASLLVQPSINSLGNSQIAAYSVDLTIYNILTIFFYSASSSVSTFCNQCLGKGKINLVKKGFLHGLIIGFCLSMPIILLSLIFPAQLASLFLQDANGETAQYIIRYIALCFPFLPLTIVTNFFHRFFRGIMVPNLALFSTVIYSIARIIFTYLLVPIYFMDGVYWGFILAWACEFIVCIIIYITKKWKSKQYLEIEKAQNA
ncbi:MAG: hypothetical protein E7347_01080 [Clostridiales bacterium]|nr:hypothetical protein [Clostridiales bacterium]